MHLSIRALQPCDYTAAAEILRDVLDLQNVTVEHLAETYGKMQEDARYGTFVAVADGNVVGLVTAVKVLAFGHPGGYVKMNGIGVLPAYRRLGIGRLLMERIEQFALDQGAPYIGLASGLRRTDAHSFYARLGYQQTSCWFRKRLS